MSMVNVKAVELFSGIISLNLCFISFIGNMIPYYTALFLCYEGNGLVGCIKGLF